VSDKVSTYDDLKKFNGKIYSGMVIGASHDWQYPNGRWKETKVTPDKWEFSFESLKRRTNTTLSSYDNSGPAKGTIYHWYILADQKAEKLDLDSYQTSMHGLKFKVGHKRPYWRNFSYEYKEQMSYKEKIIKVLEEVLKGLKRNSIEY
jgi:hypothetical protein